MNALEAEWGLMVSALEYVPKGAGSHHWVAVSGAGDKWFISVDALADNQWLGPTPDAAHAALTRALATAARLAAGSLEFVLAPLPDVGGRPCVRLDSGYSVAVYPYLEGESGDFGRMTAELRSELAQCLKRLNSSSHLVEDSAGRVGIELSDRPAIESALNELDRPWTEAPVRTCAGVAHRPGRPPEADAPNSMAWSPTSRGRSARSSPMASPTPATSCEPTGAFPNRLGYGRPCACRARPLAPRAAGPGRRKARLELYRLRWALEDVGIFLGVFRAVHVRSADIDLWWRELQRYLAQP